MSETVYGIEIRVNHEMLSHCNSFILRGTITVDHPAPPGNYCAIFSDVFYTMSYHGLKGLQQGKH
ncbi:MAG: hypothetical protein NMNS01_19060 [Nitrosomonas sp.]|nr:MAG: hypothetical protein NMNS01_19060 [Nitrosomonas sp.]